MVRRVTLSVAFALSAVLTFAAPAVATGCIEVLQYKYCE